MRRRVVMCWPLVLVFAASFGAVSQMSPDSNWSPGTYWTYDTSVTQGGIRTDGELTFIVLGEDDEYGLHRWYLAVITQWYDGAEILTTVAHSSPLNPFPWRRWPLIVEFIPPTHLPAYRGQLRLYVGNLGLPWLHEELAMEISIQESELKSETVALTESPQGAPSHTECSMVEGLVAIHYEWHSNYSQAEIERIDGTAWWSHELGWWSHAEGQGPEGTFEICLDSSDVLSSEDMIDRLSNALESTAAIDPDFADSRRIVFERIGIEFPSD